MAVAVEPVSAHSGAMTRYVALYCRISIDRNGRREGVQAQERWGRAYAAATWPGLPVRVFKDNHLSAADDNVVRPDYESLKAAIDRGEVEHVWTVEQYRIERREIQWFQLAAQMDAAGITELHTNRDGIVRVQDEVAGIKAVLGAGEVRRMKRRINDTLAEKASNGEPPGSRPFGYVHGKLPDGTKTYVQVPAQAAAIRQAAEWVLSGWSLANIAAQLRKRGLEGAHGGKITPGAVKGMVTSPTIAGHRVYKNRIVARGNWEPILDEVTWQACRVKLSEPRRVTRADGKGEYAIGKNHNGNSTGRKYLLTGGLAVCGVCKNRMTGTMQRVGNEKVPYLLCHPNVGGKGCTGIVMEKAEANVIERLWAKLDNPEFLASVVADEHGARRREIADALDALNRQRGELAALWATPGELTATEWKEARDGLKASERALRSELAELPPPVINVDIEGVKTAWPDMTIDEQREFVRLFITKITVSRLAPGKPRRFDPERLDIKYIKR
jgi:site-specific DNA recombinase